MSNNTNDVSRRSVLKTAGSAMAVAGASGLASANGHVEVNVGYSADSGRKAAVDAASDVVREFGFGALTVRVPEQAVSGLQNRGDVRYVELNGTVQAHAQTLPWGIDRVDADIAHDNGDTGSGADIAILDTGIDGDHPDLQANVGNGKDFTGKGTWDDGNGHGTHCAGIADAVDNSEGVVGVSTEATLHAGKVLDDSGSGSFSDVAAGIEWAADQGYDVASLSLGASSGSSTLQDAVDYAYNNGVLVVSSAGNSGPCSDCVGYPAAYSNAMAISSTDSDDSLSSFSSTGPEIELAAPGGSVYSTYAGGGYDTLSGTSMSCPHVSGAGAQLMANGQSNTEARSTLQNSAEDIGLGDNEQGSGLLDVEAALNGDSGGGGTGDTAPAIDTFSVSNQSNGGWARFEVSWGVSDADGDLSSVDLTLTQSSTVDSASYSVSGSSASGSDRLQDKKGSGSYDVTLTVTDSKGNTTSQTTTVTA